LRQDCGDCNLRFLSDPPPPSSLRPRMYTIQELFELVTNPSTQAAVQEAARNIAMGVGAKAVGGRVADWFSGGDRQEVERALRNALVATLRQHRELEEIEAPLARWLGRPPASDAFLRVLEEPELEPDPQELDALLEDTPFDPATFPVPVTELVTSLRKYFLAVLFRNKKTRSLYDAIVQREQVVGQRLLLRRQGAILSAQQRMEELLQELIACLPSMQAAESRGGRRAPFMVDDLPEYHVDRPELFDTLKRQLLGTHSGSVTITTALHGAGGFGKTTAALALCHAEEIRREFSAGILWVTLGETPDLLAKLAELYAAMTGERPAFRRVEDAAVQFSETLAQLRCLIVLDDVWKPDHLQPFRRGGHRCVRLITSRNRAILRGAAGIDVDEMTGSEAVRMLSGRVGSPAHLHAAFTSLARRLGEWPLLLDLAAGTMQERMAAGDTADGALRYLNEALDRRGAVAFDQSDSEARNLAVGRSLDASLGLLDDVQRSRLLELSIFPEDTNVPFEAIGELWDTDLFGTDELVQRFHRLSLLRADPGARTVRLHDVVRAHYASQLSSTAPPVRVHQRLMSAWGDLHHLPHEYAWRWIAYHLTCAEEHAKLQILLLDYRWIQAKLKATNIQSLLTDYNGLSSQPHQAVQNALRLSAHVLSERKDELSQQLMGRLLESEFIEVRWLLAQAASALPDFMYFPMTLCLEPPSRGLLRTLGDGLAGVDVVRITPDGRRAVSLEGNTRIRVWDLEAGELERTIEPRSGWISDIALSGDGLSGLIGLQNSTVQFWDFGNGQHLATQKIHDGPVICVSITADGKWAISASRDRTLAIWDMHRRGLQHRLKVPRAAECIASTEDGMRVLTVSDDRYLRVWDTGSGAMVASEHVEFALHIAVTSTFEGLRAVVCGSHCSARILDYDGYQFRSRAISHCGNVTCAALSSAGGYGILGSGKVLHVSDLDTAVIQRTFRGHERDVNAIAVSRDGRRTVSASSDGTLKIWDPVGESSVSIPGWHDDEVQCAAISVDGSRAVTVSSTSVKIWDVMGARLKNNLNIETGLFVHYRVASDCRQLTATSGRTATTWDLESGAIIQKVELPGDFRDIYVFSDRRQVLVRNHKGEGGLWDPESSRMLWTWEHVETSSDSPIEIWGGSSLAVIRNGRTVRVLDTESGQVTRVFEGAPEPVRPRAVSQDSRSLYCTSQRGNLLKLDLGTGTWETTLIGLNDDRIICLVPGMMGVWIAARGRGDRRLQVRNPRFPHLNSEFSADSAIKCIAVHPHGTAVVVGDAFGRVAILHMKVPLDSGIIEPVSA